MRSDCTYKKKKYIVVIFFNTTCPLPDAAIPVIREADVPSPGRDEGVAHAPGLVERFMLLRFFGSSRPSARTGNTLLDDNDLETCSMGISFDWRDTFAHVLCLLSCKWEPTHRRWLSPFCGTSCQLVAPFLSGITHSSTFMSTEYDLTKFATFYAELVSQCVPWQLWQVIDAWGNSLSQTLLALPPPPRFALY